MEANGGNGDAAAAGAKYSWLLTSTGMFCYKNPAGGQTVFPLWEVAEESEFHDAALADATREINTIVADLDRNNEDKDRVLSLIEFQNRHLLVWARYVGVGPEHDDDTIVQALKLKT